METQVNIKLSGKTHKSVTINGQRFRYSAIINKYCQNPDSEGLHWLGYGIQIIRRCHCVLISQQFSGEFVVVEK